MSLFGPYYFDEKYNGKKGKQIYSIESNNSSKHFKEYALYPLITYKRTREIIRNKRIRQIFSNLEKNKFNFSLLISSW